MLHPQNLVRFHAQWIDPSPSCSEVVDAYWSVRWNLRPHESVDQRIVDLPAVTLSVERGAVPAPLVVTGVHSRAWTRTIAGSGSVFGIRLRPAGLALVSRLGPADVADTALPVDRDLDAQVHDLLSTVATEDDPLEMAARADAVIGDLVGGSAPDASLLLANAVVDHLRSRLDDRAGPLLASRFGVSQRTVQRALSRTLGHGPKWVARRIRLQHVAQALATVDDRGLARLATDLGYVDQAHLAHDFRAVTGLTPGAYARSLRGLVDDHVG